ncbi:MAG: helix-turn-helix transcriptional regulator [Verrucomicrobiaceae bacterium]|jgi:transcriptional regulator with XRE-family HTH domain|nr:helix-turn-helix transcriptional regulator [Verrucomicrobiaceae bacterium]
MKLSRDELDAEVKLHLYVRSYCLILRRREAGLSQDELADRAGLARGSVQHAEHARTGMNDATRFRLLHGLDLCEPELDGQIMRVKEKWRRNGLAEKVRQANSLAEVLGEIEATMGGER